MYPDLQGISSKYMSWQVWQKMALMYGSVMAGMTKKLALRCGKTVMAGMAKNWHLGVVNLTVMTDVVRTGQQFF